MIQDSLHLRDEEGSYKPFVHPPDVMSCLPANVMMEMLRTKMVPSVEERGSASRCEAPSSGTGPRLTRSCSVPCMVLKAVKPADRLCFDVNYFPS